MKKIYFDLIVILLFGVLFVILIEFNLLEKYIGFLLIPVVIAYFLGQFAVKKFKE